MHYWSSLLVAFFMLNSCADNADMRLLYDDAKNHKVFKISASIYPLQTEVESKDTIWITIELPEQEMHDLVTEKDVAIKEARYVCQLELQNVDNIDEVVDATFIVEQGAFYEDHSVSSKTTKNGYGFSFGYPENENLNIGVILNQSGKYALWFNNFPNPFHGCKGNSCDQGRGYWFDIYYRWNTENDEFEKSDFVDYIFSTKHDELNAMDLDKDAYLEYCIYPESIYFFNVK